MSPLLKIMERLLTSGLEVFGRYYSCYRGYVVDNKDPDSYGRIKVKVPEVYGEYVMDYWAWQKNGYSGKDYGIQIVPNVKDMVWVEFEKGDPRKPIWSFGHFSKINNEKEKPEDLKDIQKYWLKTPEGHLVLINDKDNEIQVVHKDNNELTLKKEEIYIKHSSGDEVIINKTGISLKTGTLSLGSLDGSKEKAVLGDSLKGSLDDLTTEITNLLTTLQTIGSSDSVNASKYGLTYASNLTASIPPILIKINVIKSKYEKFLSSKVTID